MIRTKETEERQRNGNGRTEASPSVIGGLETKESSQKPNTTGDF